MSMPTLGTFATVFVHSENGEPRRVDGEGRSEIGDLYGPVDDFPVVSVYSFHVALYALQNPTTENIGRALTALGSGGDCEEWVDDSLLPLPVPEPHGWAFVAASGQDGEAT